MSAATPSQRALLVQEVFRQCIDARLRFNEALMKCALKGWPDKSAAIDTAFRAQESMLKRLSVRLDHLIHDQACSDAELSSYTTTAMVQARVQEDWTEEEEATLARGDTNYIALNRQIEELKGKADPAGLEGPYEMARRDPELVNAGRDLNNRVWDLDQKLSE